MRKLIDSFVASLRSELQDYGELLARLEEEQDCVIHRASERLLHTVQAVRSQAAVVEQARRRREECRSAVARALGIGSQTSLSELVAALPEEYRPLVEALVQENNDLLARLQQRARQNHLLLARSLELMRQLLGAFGADQVGTVYGSQGAVREPDCTPRGLCEALA